MGEKRIGRPKKYTTKTTQVTFYIPFDVLEEVDERAGELGITRSEWINRAIREKLERELREGSREG